MPLYGLVDRTPVADRSHSRVVHPLGEVVTMNVRYLIPVLLVLVGCSEPVPRDLDTLVQQGEDLYLDRETMEPYSGPVLAYG